jgi:mono/diheme cytochrome c family protein
MKALRSRKSAATNPRRLVARALVWGFVALLLPAGIPPAAGAPNSKAPAVFQQYCFQCHGEAAAMAGVSLQRLTAAPSVGDSFQQWEKIAAMLEQSKMPPQGMPQPTDAERQEAVNWIRAELDQYVERHAGDPGQVTLRRLTSGEYAYTIRDLTGLDLNVENDVPADSVGGEGFTNFGDVQFMQDANLERYLITAKRIASHAVIGSGPLEFYSDPGMSGFELSAIHRIHDIYRDHGFRAVAAEGGRAFGLERYGKAFFATWQYRHREALGGGNTSLDEFAAREDLSPRFIQHIWSVLQQESPSYPTSEVISRWRSLPAPGTDSSQTAEQARTKCEEIQQFVINWPRWLFAAGELAAGGAGDERALVITDAALEAKPNERLRYFQRVRDSGKATVHISVLPTDPNFTEPSVVIWRNATVQNRRRDRSAGPGSPLKDLLDEETVNRLSFGKLPDGSDIAPGEFAMASNTSVSFEVPVPEGAGAFGLTVEAELAGGPAGNVVRLLISESEEESRGRPTWALLANPDSEGYRSWKSDVLEYAASFPQTSHGEPTPSDRDPIPAPFNNTYNQPERDRFHFRVKYYRDDQFLVEKMLDNATREKLDNAWLDLMASFEYHDAFLDFVSDKFSLGLGEKGVADLTAAEIDAMPAEARGYVKALSEEYQAVQAAQLAAQPGHLEDAIRFAGQAWRRPLTAQEQDSLRRFYTTAREEMQLDHAKAIRALLTRVLVAPAFLYRLEQPGERPEVTELSSWELASRLSYFLWSSVPDEELRRAAAAGELSKPKQLDQQVRRMLADPKARRLATEFFGQWLGFYRFDEHRGVDAGRFPEFTDAVKTAMYDEAVSFFDHVVRRGRPIREILSADYTFLNQALAKHYGVEKEIASSGPVELVEVANQFQRGGLLRLGAVLTATSAPMRTSPVKRGDWVLRRILNSPTPPPPADAGTLPGDPASFGGMTVRQRLEAHQRNATCANCHSRIDPLGFPLEHYDAVGRWRNEYSDGQPIDDSATLADETHIAGMDGLLDYLEAQEQQVLRTLGFKLAGYALGRTVLASDRPLIDEIVTAGGDATFAELASKVVSSRQFRYHRGREDHALAAARSTGAASAR